MFSFIKENKLAFLMLLTVGIVMGVLISTNLNVLPSGKAVTPADKLMVQQVGGEIDVKNSFIKVADEVGPAIVSISVEKVQKIGGVRQFHFSPFSRKCFMATRL